MRVLAIARPALAVKGGAVGAPARRSQARFLQAALIRMRGWPGPGAFAKEVRRANEFIGIRSVAGMIELCARDRALWRSLKVAEMVQGLAKQRTPLPISFLPPNAMVIARSRAPVLQGNQAE